ncbi:similar to Saccharomyces cerevisiae YNL097C PHO23 Probable component of the Rpd3 histone deacetylase complex, involved in transcriptional regulation of PHO5 [Maudiozyma saulgeensis]|uniref:Chromatin modification-related protein n=1 Tax=Maudiozyma saulgeensis TaxID=1789683 RepID=A0A1X7QYX6_9SACH|nr:similar to Saccharomyces cerevisiae YNL097C PHO23 Probable component of the Rpd3 histone deacetylase complex, involved in transcriptional regulation of PHO5 [Kazachstania saulgeensis]
MSTPANLYPGLNDIADVLEEYPIETSRYLTLLHEIDAKCIYSRPDLNDKIDSFLKESFDKSKLPVEEFKSKKLGSLSQINTLFEELMPSLEEKMHVSSIMLESLQALNNRLELAYEVALRNQEIPTRLRLGNDNHPAMHLHHELMDKIENKSAAKSSQALKSESRREAMAAQKKQNQKPAQQSQAQQSASEDDKTTTKPKRVANGSSNEPKRRKRRVNTEVLAKKQETKPIPAAVEPVVTSVYADRPKTNDYGEPLYCYCNQVAYGEMVGCDGDSCELEWFHLPCIGLETLPKGKWYCKDCQNKLKLKQ